MTTTPGAPFSPLVAQILTAQAAFTADVTDRLVDSLTTENAELRARAAAIEDAVLSLLNAPYLPQPDVIRRALFPSAEVVDAYRTAVTCPFCSRPVPGLLAGCDQDDCRKRENAEDHAYSRSLDV